MFFGGIFTLIHFKQKFILCEQLETKKFPYWTWTLTNMYLCLTQVSLVSSWPVVGSCLICSCSQNPKENTKPPSIWPIKNGMNKKLLRGILFSSLYFFLIYHYFISGNQNTTNFNFSWNWKLVWSELVLYL